MKADIYWADKYLAILARPRGGDWLEDEIKSLAESGLNVIISLLTADEEVELNLTQERENCLAVGLAFYSFPIIDRSVPASMDEAFDLVVQLSTLIIRDSNKIGIHCRQGLGQSPLIAAALLVRLGNSPDEAFQKISQTRGVEVPETLEQKSWLNKFARKFCTVLS